MTSMHFLCTVISLSKQYLLVSSLASHSNLGILNGLLYVQANRKILETDEWLRVTGCEAVYAIGDCASVHQRKIMVFLKY